MRKRFLFALVLTLCVCSLLFSVPAYATNSPATENPVQTPQEEPTPSETPGAPVEPEPSEPDAVTPTPEPSESAVPQTAFTPDGTGTVMDNAVDGDGKEFFTIKTEDGNVFYLIIDRQRSSENVYLLGAVTEDDLMSLAQKVGGQSESGIPTGEPPGVSPSPKPSPEPSPEPQNNGGAGGGTIIFIIIAALVVGVAGYYFKIIKPRKQAPDDDEDYDDGMDDDGGEDDADDRCP